MTLAQQAGITEFPYVIHDSKGRQIYFETSGGVWSRTYYDWDGDTYQEYSNGYWKRKMFDSNGKAVFGIDSLGYWFKCFYDESGQLTEYQNSNGAQKFFPRKA
jgi:hypothetical protein